MNVYIDVTDASCIIINCRSGQTFDLLLLEFIFIHLSFIQVTTFDKINNHKYLSTLKYLFIFNADIKSKLIYS